MWAFLVPHSYPPSVGWFQETERVKALFFFSLTALKCEGEGGGGVSWLRFADFHTFCQVPPRNFPKTGSRIACAQLPGACQACSVAAPSQHHARQTAGAQAESWQPGLLDCGATANSKRCCRVPAAWLDLLSLCT